MLGKSKIHDGRVQRALDGLGVRYSVDSDGDFRVVLETSKGRTQMVWVNSTTSKYRDLETREVWSIAYESAEPFPAELSFYLLLASRIMKLGAWEVAKMNEKYCAVFSATISADADPATLAAVINFVAECADEMEEKISSGDDY